MTETPEIVPPSWMRAAEKSVFNRVVLLRNRAGSPVFEREIDVLVDYASAQGRLAQLRKLARRQDPEADFGRLMAIHRQINATTAMARRLAKTLRIG